MKNYLLFLSVALVLIACDSSESELHSAQNNNLNARTSDLPPANTSNDFDFVGQVYDEVLQAYYLDTIFPKNNDSIISKVNLTASLHVYFDNVNPIDYNLVPESRIASIVSDSNLVFDSIVNNLSLSSQAKVNFRLFIADVLSKVDNNEDYLSIYNDIIAYETQIVTSSDYTATEKEYLLTITSIVRHSVCEKGKRPKKNTDLDWDWLTANIVGAVDGAQYGKTHAILAALKAGVIDNK